MKTLCASLGEKPWYLQKTGFNASCEQGASGRAARPCGFWTGVARLAAVWLEVHDMHVPSLILVSRFVLVCVVFCCFKGTNLLIRDENPVQSVSSWSALSSALVSRLTALHLPVHLSTPFYLRCFLWEVSGLCFYFSLSAPESFPVGFIMSGITS